uniref:C-type lectin domain-containing protein n=1 Tax=Nothobranchius furzeri TaxID=105023 RepID=A0A8C6MM13_NOTFU
VGLAGLTRIPCWFQWDHSWNTEPCRSGLLVLPSLEARSTPELRWCRSADSQGASVSDPGFDRDSVSSVSEALKQLSALDTISRTVAALKCTIERRLNNGSMSAGCCPLGWEMLESSCYYFSKIPLSWHEARDWCNGHESHLVILMRDEEWDFVTRMAGGTFFWVGLTDEKSGRWEWVNQTPYVMDRRRWRPGQPDSWTHHGLGPGDEDCAHLHYEGQLNDLHYTVSAPEPLQGQVRALGGLPGPHGPVTLYL